ncbi:hypothetical protein Rsub_11376 [Raphidocelis subcapitata]|uniref:Uncharacterized protein n=1 Tax=Raphidocelis subcapitata TaxID=307507 RepID=A0A2V0PG17_9CHLO|nr:hypothetical protein Rsub_11376 [Raphidocelis subcapitata]|eukprot:GBF98794.1 hypothetical protein Rsub_11376 [Raphidocelis subcapitata]
MARRHRSSALATIALLALAAIAAPAAAQAAPTAEQKEICARAASPAKCAACVASAKDPAAAPAMTALTCMVCGSLADAAAQDLCAACVKNHGYASGCSTCAGAALYGLADKAKPSDKGLATAGSCFACNAKAPDMQGTPACSACWMPNTKDPKACSSCVAGATGVAPAARGACFGLYSKTTADAAGAAACLAAAKAPADAALCPLCAAAGGKAEQAACFVCMDKVAPSLPGVKFLCHVTGAAADGKPSPALAAAAPAYHACLAAAKTLEAGQACRKCMDGIEKDAKSGGACFAKLKA